MKENSPTPNNNPAKTPWFFPFEKGRFPTLKKRKPGVYVFFALFLLFGVVILGESAVPANASGSQSNTFSSFLATFVNWFNPPSVGKVIEPTGLKLVDDTTLLSPDADMTPQFALGTTSRLTFALSYPEKSDAKDSFDENFAVSSDNGVEGTDFTINRSIDKTNQKIYLRINGKKLSSSPYRITLTAGSSLSATYSFHVVDLPAPTSFTIAKPTVSTLKVGTSYPLAITLTDPRSGISESEKKSDHDLRRYFNPALLKPTSTDKNVLSVDEYGVVRAHKEGQATIAYPGLSESFSFTVSGTASAMPTALSLSGNGTTNLTDYDFYTPNASGEDGYEDYSMALAASFTGNVPEDQGVTFASLDPLTAKIIPYSYDSKTGVASYHNEAGAPACRVQGYRNEGEARIMAISNANEQVNTMITLHVHGATAMTMYPSIVDDTALNTNNQLFVSATFAPKNTANGAITLSLKPEGIVSISNNGTNTVTLTALSQGSCVVTITSVSNSSLTSKVILTVTDPGLINDTNFNSFAAFTRKAAGHFALFLMTAIIGAIFFNLFFADPHSDYFALIVSCFWGFLLAGFSEMIQFLGDLWWHSGRTGAWLDVGTDTLGYIIGALLSWGVILFIRWIKKKRLLKKEQSVSEKTPVAK
jgi:hypothetical protein